MNPCGLARPSGTLYPPPLFVARPRRGAPMVEAAPFAPPVPVPEAPPPDPVALGGEGSDPWADTPTGALVRWEPNARLAAKGREAVEGTLRALGRGTSTRFARIATPDGVAQVWENQGALTTLGGGAAPRPPAPPVAPALRPAAARPQNSRRSATVSAPSSAVPSVFAGWKPAPVKLPDVARKDVREFAVALQRVEAVLPLLSGRPYAPIVAALRAARADLERGRLPATDTALYDRWGAIRDASLPAQWMAVAAVLHLLGNGRLDLAKSTARETRAAVEFDEAGGDWGKALVEATGDTRYGPWFDDDPTLSGAPPPPAEAVERVVQMAADDEYGYAMVDPAEATQGAFNASSRQVQDWLRGGDSERACHMDELHLFQAKAAFLEGLREKQRTGTFPDEIGRSYLLRERYHALQRCRLFIAAKRAGLRNPAALAKPRVMRVVEAAAAAEKARMEPLLPPIVAALRAGAASLRRLAPMVRADFERARETNRALRVAQTASIAETMERRLLDTAADLDGSGAKVESYDSRLSALAWAAGGGWDYDLVDYRNESAYAKAARKIIREAKWDVEHALAPILRKLDHASVRKFAEADAKHKHLQNVHGYAGPWAAAYDRVMSPSTGANVTDWIDGKRLLTVRPRAEA